MQIKNHLLGNAESIYDFWEKRIDEYENKGQKNINSISFEQFKNLKKELNFNKIDYNFWQSFKQHKKKT